MKENGLVLTGDWRPKERREQGRQVAEAIARAESVGTQRGWLVRTAIWEFLKRTGYLTVPEKGKK